MLPFNITKLELEPCKKCKSFELDNDLCTDHWVEAGPEAITHFKIRGEWYMPRRKWVRPLLSLVEVDDRMIICGRLDSPGPIYIENLTDMLTIARKCGCSEKELEEVFPPEQVKRMRGRVLKELVRG